VLIEILQTPPYRICHAVSPNFPEAFPLSFVCLSSSLDLEYVPIMKLLQVTATTPIRIPAGDAKTDLVSSFTRSKKRDKPSSLVSSAPLAYLLYSISI
jgi:hypothetical protein